MADEENGRVPLYAYGVCEGCGHALLLAGAADGAVYASPAYYQTQGTDGVGYSAYEGEREYREAKADRLLQWAMAATQLAPTTLLEVGSGFGFTRRAAERLGLRTAGVDVNPAAADAARRLYEMDTFVGTLADAMDIGKLGEETMDLVLYDFVLEHLADPVQELARAARMLSPQGVLVVRVPGIEALELVPFGSLYRSFRRDHLHLFSRDSISRMLHAAGLTLTVFDTACGADLLREVLTPSELRSVYAAGRGPDITICATRK
jgi:SAM-dependent methyltransferase